MAASFCTLAGIICLLYYLIIILYAGITADFAWFWIFAGGSMEMVSCLIRYGIKHPGCYPLWLRGTVGVLLAAGLLIFSFLCTKVIKGMRSPGSSGLDYVVVLGAQVKGEVPSKALHKRLVKALQYLRENEDTMLILSGGQGPGEEITEAECMRRWLAAQGVKPEKMILEEDSVSTRENLEFSERMTDCADRRTGILSNNFHVYRAVRLARKLGYQYAQGIAADSDSIMQVHYVVREVFALVKEKLKGNI